MNKKLFLKIGLTVGKMVVPQIALAEGIVDAVQQVRSGKDKREAVLKAATDAVQLIEFGANKDLVNDAEFLEGLRLVNDGNVKIMRAINRVQPKEEGEP